MTITRQVAERSTCLRAKVGAVIVRDRNILATVSVEVCYRYAARICSHIVFSRRVESAVPTILEYIEVRIAKTRSDGQVQLSTAKDVSGLDIHSPSLD